mmetsp:Transcript_44435/g.111683  ORF Transcript_44435/g.111683 Transcript_44435/m.111683 type:complete len:89 (-) Transcript_44435:369-635(-)
MQPLPAIIEPRSARKPAQGILQQRSPPARWVKNRTTYRGALPQDEVVKLNETSAGRAGSGKALYKWKLQISELMHEAWLTSSSSLQLV